MTVGDVEDTLEVSKDEDSNNIVLEYQGSLGSDLLSRQRWKRNVLDDVDDWFTLYNEATDKYLTARDDVREDNTFGESKNDSTVCGSKTRKIGFSSKKGLF